MGTIEFARLPRYVAIKVSMHKWCIATLYGDSDREGGEPSYVITSDKMTQSQCDSTLAHLQRKEREKEKNS